jgi:hypothetical protein
LVSHRTREEQGHDEAKEVPGKNRLKCVDIPVCDGYSQQPQSKRHKASFDSERSRDYSRETNIKVGRPASPPMALGG